MVRTMVRLVLIVSALVVLGDRAGAEIQKREPLPCKLFSRDTDGSWIPKAQIKLVEGGLPITLGPGLWVRPGGLIIGLERGFDLGAALEAECGPGAPT
jgi:hypothetical protein